MRQSAHLMASTVAGCMAIVTCKELLRSSLANSLRNYLNSLDLDPNQLEGVVQVCICILIPSLQACNTYTTAWLKSFVAAKPLRRNLSTA